MTEAYKCFCHAVNGYTEEQIAQKFGVTQPTISKRLAALEREYPGLRVAVDICQRIHKGERGITGGSP